MHTRIKWLTTQPVILVKLRYPIHQIHYIISGVQPDYCSVVILHSTELQFSVRFETCTTQRVHFVHNCTGMLKIRSSNAFSVSPAIYIYSEFPQPFEFSFNIHTVLYPIS